MAGSPFLRTVGQNPAYRPAAFFKCLGCGGVFCGMDEGDGLFYRFNKVFIRAMYLPNMSNSMLTIVPGCMWWKFVFW